MLRIVAGNASRVWSCWLLIILTLVCGLAIHAEAAIATPGFTAGDVVIYRVGTGASALSSSATPVFLDEFEPSGKLVESIALPTSASGPNKSLLASGSAASEGLLTLSADSNYLMATGYAASNGTAKVAETTSASVPRTVARVSSSGEINTTTALADAASANNIRSATSSDGTKIWVGGAAGGVRYATLGSSTSTSLNETDKNVREVSVVDGHLYTSADPTKAGAVTIATVGSGLPTTTGQSITNFTFSAAPKQPYAYSLLTLGSGTTPDTLYLADSEAGAVVKYGLLAGMWTREGSVTVANVTGLTANDVSGTVSIFATSSGAEGKGGTLYEITDTSGVGGILSGTASVIATAPANEAFRGVAFAPGTTIGSGGPPPPPAPTITPAESYLPAALGDPTNPTLALTVSDPVYEAGELTVKATSSNTTVAPTVTVTGSGASRTLTVTAGAAGYSTLTLTVEAPDASSATTTVTYGVSAAQGDASDRYYTSAGNASSAIDVGGGYLILGDDESNVLRLYQQRTSGAPVKTFDFTKVLPSGSSEIDIESSARAGNTLYWMGSLSNKKSGKAAPERDIVFAATISGSGASTELTYLGSYTHLREDIVAWDQANGDPLGLAAASATGVPSNRADGFNAEGLEFAPGSTSTAYIGFRAPIEPLGSPSNALLVPVTNFSSLVTGGNPGSTPAIFAAPITWNLGGLGIREIRKNSSDEYLLIAGTPDDSNSSFGLYTWDGNPADQPALSDTALTSIASGAWESIVSVPHPLSNGVTIELLEDNGESAWYGDGRTSKSGLPAGLQKDLGRLVTLTLPAPTPPGQPHLIGGTNPSANGALTLAWAASAATGTPTYTLQHENAGSGWSVVAGGISSTEYSFSPSPENEGTWNYRVIATDQNGESEPSEPSVAVKVDELSPNQPLASPDRAPDYTPGGGWYRDTVQVSFGESGDPALADGSSGSGVDPASIPAPELFSSDGSHAACAAVRDYAGNESTTACLTVQVDATAPSVAVNCPATVPIGASATATVTATDGQSGLASDPSGTVPIDTSKGGPQTITRTALDNVGHTSSASCTTEVGYTQVITGNLKGNLVVKAGQAIELTASAKVSGTVTVKPGGTLDVEGATLSGALKANSAAFLRICAADIGGPLNASNGTGAVVIGDGTATCAGSAVHGATTLKGNTAGVTVNGDTFHASLRVIGNASGATVVNNTIAGALTVTGNTGTVIDSPNEVEGRSKLQ